MEIKFEDYLSEQERKEIISNVFYNMCSEEFKKDSERIFNNAAYQIIYKIIDDAHNNEISMIIAEKTKNLINELSEYSVFRRASAWEQKESEGYKALNLAIAEHKQLLSNKISQLIENLDKDELKETLIEEARELLNIKLFGKE